MTRTCAEQGWKQATSAKKSKVDAVAAAKWRRTDVIYEYTATYIYTRSLSGVVNCSQGVMQEKCITMEKAFAGDRPEGRVMQRVRMKEHMKRMLRRLLRRGRESIPCNNNDDVQTIELLSSSDLDITGVRGWQ